jgi:microcystin-dependent protein
MNGAPVTGQHNLRVQLWPAAEGGMSPLCETQSTRVELQAGRFSIALPDGCVAVVRANRDLWAAVEYDGDGLGRRKLGAVPFAISAAEASAATGELAKQTVPAGAVMAFDLNACPTGWTEYAAAQGRTLVGAQADLARGTALGSDSLKLKVRNLPAHSHSGVTQGGNSMVYRTVNQAGPSTANNHATGWTGGPYTQLENADYAMAAHTHNFSTDSVGEGDAFDNRQASLALLYCRKD